MFGVKTAEISSKQKTNMKNQEKVPKLRRVTAANLNLLFLPSVKNRRLKQSPHIKYINLLLYHFSVWKGRMSWMVNFNDIQRYLAIPRVVKVNRLFEESHIGLNYRCFLRSRILFIANFSAHAHCQLFFTNANLVYGWKDWKLCIHWRLFRF